MPPTTAAHRAAEERFRALLTAADLDPPDRVTYGADSLTFFWDGPKVAVVVDLEDDVGTPLDPASASTGRAA